MKKAFALGLCILSMSSLALVSCNDATSAYEIAVKNGFNGTEKEWLESLKGANGLPGSNGKDGVSQTTYELYTEAVKNGEYSDSYMNFLTEIIGGEYSMDKLMNKSLLSGVSLLTTWKVTSMKYGVNGPYTTESESNASGSAIIIDIDHTTGDAYLLTNYHMCYSNNQSSNNGISEQIKGSVWGYEYSEYQFDCTYIGGSIDIDLAVLKVEGADVLKKSEYKAVEFGNCDNIYVGEPVYKIGNDNGEGICASKGEISLTSHNASYSIGSKAVSPRCIRTTAPHNGGNSGGGLFNEFGELIGINNCKVEQTGKEALSYSIPVAYAKPFADHVIKNYETCGKTINTKCMLGIKTKLCEAYVYFNPEVLAYQSRNTVIVNSIDDESICKGILEVDDIIKSATLNGVVKKIYAYYEVSDFLYGAFEGDILTLEIERNGIPMTKEITLSYAIEL